jgi:VanZ family protein
MTWLRLLTWCCVVLLAVLSLLPAEDIVRTGFSGQFEHFIAYAGSAAIAMAGYGLIRGGARIIGCFWVYAGLLEYLQHFSLGRHPSIEDFAVSAIGALSGGLAVFLLRRPLLRYAVPTVPATPAIDRDPRRLRRAAPDPQGKP